MAYYEGEINGGFGGNNNGFGDGWWGIILIALLFGWGRGGYGFGGNDNGGAGFNTGYDLGKVATTNDVASGFNNSAVLSSLNDIKLGQSSLQNSLCQGFNGVNTSILTSANGIERAIADLGYANANCCCQTQRMIESGFANVNYNMAKNTCDIINSQNAVGQRIVDYLTNEKIASLTAEKATLTAQLSQNAQTSTLLGAINRTPVPAYVVANPYCGCVGSTVVQ